MNAEQQAAILAHVISGMGAGVIATPTRRPKWGGLKLPPPKAPAPVMPTPSEEELEARRLAVRLERERREAEIARQVAVKAQRAAACAEGYRKAHEALVAKRRAKAAAEREGVGVVGEEVVEPVKGIAALPGCEKGIFPGHPLHGLFQVWLAGRKPSKRLTKEFVKERGL